MLTARREEADKVLGLDSGADDYLTKPFGVRELVARARRCCAGRAGERRPVASGQPVTVGSLRVDPASVRRCVDGQVIDLTPHEFDVLYLLAAHPGIVFTRELLLDKVWRRTLM